MNNPVTVTVGIVGHSQAWARSIDIEPWLDDYKEAIAQLAKQVEADAFQGTPELQG